MVPFLSAADSLGRLTVVNRCRAGHQGFACYARGMLTRRALVLSAVAASAVAAASRKAHAASDPTVTVFGATWCSACKGLERGLRERGVPFDLIDVDQNPKAYEAARKATGKNVVPLTSVARDEDVTWVVGADVDAVEKAYRGE